MARGRATVSLPDRKASHRGFTIASAPMARGCATGSLPDRALVARAQGGYWFGAMRGEQLAKLMSPLPVHVSIAVMMLVTRFLRSSSGPVSAE